MQLEKQDEIMNWVMGMDSSDWSIVYYSPFYSYTKST